MENNVITMERSHTDELRDQALSAKMQFSFGMISYDDARKRVAPYIAEVNRRATELAKEHGMRAKKVSVTGYLR